MSDLLIAIPSRDKVGLAWSHRSVSGLLAQAGVAAIGFTVHRGDTLVYEGGNNNFVDQVPTGQTVSYQLGVRLADGTDMPLTGKDVKVLPMSLHRGVIGRQGDPFADRVVRFEPLSQGGYGAGLIPDNVTGPPHGRSTFSPANRPQEVVSLPAAVGSGGTIDLEFTDNIVVSGPGDDFTVFENVFFIGGDPNQRFMEPAIVSVALFPDEWHRLPCDVLPPSDGRPVNVRDPWYYARGLAGRNATTGDDPTDPTRSGGDSFDANSAIGAAGLMWIRFIRIQSTGDAARRDDSGNDLIRHNNDPAFNPLSGRGSSGFDLDAVSAVSY